MNASSASPSNIINKNEPSTHSPRLGREQNRIKKKNLCNLEDLDSTKMAGKAKARRSKRDKTHNDDAVKHCSAEEGNNTIITPLQAISISANKHNEK
jgi:hypothetical protein